MGISSLKTQTASSDQILHFVPSRPDFGVAKAIPEGISVQLQLAVLDFIKTSHTPQGIDLNGFYHQTLQAMANATVLGRGGELWLGISDGKLWTYLLTNINNDIDGRLVYFVSQAWVHKDQRGKPWVKWAWNQLRQRAKDSFCKHLVIASSRGNDEAYCRFLGKGFHKYISMLKEEI